MSTSPKAVGHDRAVPPLSRQALVTAAVKLADEEGLEALTVRRLARQLGVTPMALYWHVKNKDQLLEAVGEQMFAAVELPPPGDGPWEDELRQVLRSLLAALARHPALAPLALPTVLVSEAGLVVAERVLCLLERAGLDDSTLGDLAAYLLSSIVTLVTAQPGTGSSGTPEERDSQVALRRAHLGKLPADRYPRVVRLADHLLDCDDAARYYQRGLDLLLLGLRGMAADP